MEGRQGNKGRKHTIRLQLRRAGPRWLKVCRDSPPPTGCDGRDTIPSMCFPSIVWWKINLSHRPRRDVAIYCSFFCVCKSFVFVFGLHSCLCTAAVSLAGENLASIIPALSWLLVRVEVEHINNTWSCGLEPPHYVLEVGV